MHNVKNNIYNGKLDFSVGISEEESSLLYSGEFTYIVFCQWIINYSVLTR